MRYAILDANDNVIDVQEWDNAPVNGVLTLTGNIGDAYANGVFTPPPISLSQAQINRIAYLQGAYQAAMNAPVSFKNAAGVTSTYPAGVTLGPNGLTAKQNLADVIDAGAAAWTLGVWIDSNNVSQAFTYVDLQGLAAAMEAAVVPDFIDLMTKIAAVHNAANVAAVQAVTF